MTSLLVVLRSRRHAFLQPEILGLHKELMSTEIYIWLGLKSRQFKVVGGPDILRTQDVSAGAPAHANEERHFEKQLRDYA
jgi:hypothetical protein